MDSLNKIAHKEFRAFHYPEYFLKDILECYDWLYPWQKETFLEFYRNDYKELVACVGQRCLHPDTKVLTSDGSYKKVKNIDDGEILYGMDFESGKIRTDNCLIHENEEEKEIVELEVWTGKKIKLSHDHKVFTQRGLVEASDLKEDEDYVYIPYETDNGYVSDPHQAKILGYIIGDGTFRHTVGFSQKDEDVIKDFEKSLEKRYNCELKYTSGYDYYIVGKEKRKNKLLEEVRKLGLWMKDSHTKFIPDIVFRYDKESLIEFLRAYFKCDGTVSKDGLSVSLSSVSGRLLRDTSKLLLKLGIRSNIDYTTHKHGFRLKINDKKRFKELIGDFRDNKIKETYNNNSSPIDRLPFKCTDIGIYRNDVRYLGKDSIRLSNEHHLSNEHLRKLDELDLDKHNIPKKLNPIIEEECFFDKVVSVENVGKGKTYDITMPNIGNFFAEDILVKNSGKTLLSSLIATYELFKLLAVKKPNTYYNMPKGSDYHIMCIATNQQQSKDTVFSEIESRIDNCEWFQKQNFKKRTLDYEFKTDENSIHIRAEHSNSASLAGHTSKCLTGENRIITDSGYKKIKDINENEEIQDIELERVNNKFDNGISEVVELKTSKGYTLECTPDHEIIAFRAIEKEELGYGETHNYEIEFIEAQELQKYDEKEDEELYIPILLQGAELLDNYEYEMKDEKIPLNFDLGYILGYFIGDGSFNNNGSSYDIYISEDERGFKKEIVKKINDYFDADVNVNKHNSEWNECKNRKDMYRIAISGYVKKVFDELIDEEQRLHHNEAKVFDIIYNSNPDMIKGFLSGLFDADGHFNTEYEAGYSMKSEEFAKEIQDLLRIVGIPSYRCKDEREDKTTTWRIRIYSAGYKRILDELDLVKSGNEEKERYDLNIPYELYDNYAKKGDSNGQGYKKKLGLTTQKKTVKKKISEDNKLYDNRYFKNDFFFDKLESIENKGKKQVYDFEVENERHEYTANGFKVHNCTVLDELARFKESGGERSADIVYETSKRTLTTFGNKGKMVSISSPIHKDDFMMRLLRQGRNMDNVMTVHKSTFEANPNITREDLAMEFERDPDSAKRDYLAQPPESLESYFKEPEKIEQVIDSTIKTPQSEYELPDIQPIDYPCFLAGDPAFKNDRFGIAMAYFHPQEGLKIPLAHAFEPDGGRIAEIDAEEVVNYIKRLINKHNIAWFITDIWNYPSALKEIRKSGVKIEQNNVQRKEYDALKEQIYEAAKDGRTLLPPNDILIRELKQLELHQGSKIDHPSRGSKDIADAVANASYHCIERKDGAVKPTAFVI